MTELSQRRHIMNLSISREMAFSKRAFSIQMNRACITQSAKTRKIPHTLIDSQLDVFYIFRHHFVKHQILLAPKKDNLVMPDLYQHQHTFKPTPKQVLGDITKSVEKSKPYSREVKIDAFFVVVL